MASEQVRVAIPNLLFSILPSGFVHLRATKRNVERYASHYRRETDVGDGQQGLEEDSRTVRMVWHGSYRMEPSVRADICGLVDRDKYE